MREREKRSASENRLVGAFAKRAAQPTRLLSQRQTDDGWQCLLSSLKASQPQVQRPSPRRTQVRPWLLVFASATVATALTLVSSRMLPWWAKPTLRPLVSSRMLKPQEEPALRYTVENLVKSSGNSFASSSHEDSSLLFSDGSRVALGVGTQLTLDGLDAHGARLRLVDGVLDVSIRARANNAWTFAAGPFRMQVKGTAFRLEYAADRGQMNLQAKQGLVEVFAPPNHAVTVRVGESMELFAEQPAQAEIATTVTEEGELPPALEAAASAPKEQPSK